MILLCNFLFQSTLAVDEDEFYCKSKSSNQYKSACKRCLNDADCDYEKELNTFKSCHCSNLELLNDDGGKGLEKQKWNMRQNILKSYQKSINP